MTRDNTIFENSEVINENIEVQDFESNQEEVTIDALKDLQEKWSEMNRRLDRLNDSLIETGRLSANMKIQTAQQKLKRRYKRFIYLCLICLFVFPCYTLAIPTEASGYPLLESIGWRITLALSFFIFFLVDAIFEFRLYNKVDEIDIGKMSIDTIARLSYNIKRCHLKYQVIVMILAIIVLSIYGYFIYLNEPLMLFGFMFGAIIGLAIGLPLFFNFMRDFRKMMYPYSDLNATEK